MSIDKLETTNLNRKNRVPKFTHTIRCQFYGEVIVQIAKKALDILGIVAPDGERYYEGTRYRLWQKGEILTITAKDDRGEILRLENGGIGGYLSSADVEAFQIFKQSLEQQLEEAKIQKYQTS